MEALESFLVRKRKQRKLQFCSFSCCKHSCTRPVGTSRIDTTDQRRREAVDPTRGSSGLVSQLPGLSPTLLSTLAVFPLLLLALCCHYREKLAMVPASKPLFELCKIGKEYVSDVYVAEEQARQTERIHTKEKRFARQLHMDAKKQASQLSCKK